MTNSQSIEYILKIMENRYKSTKNRIPNKIFGLFLYGSQNYGLDTEKSDVDNICVVFPTAEEFMYRKDIGVSQISDEYGDITFWDIRKFFNLLKKGSFNTLELLFSDFYVVNSEYIEEFNRIYLMKDSISKFNQISTMHSFLGMIDSLCKDINRHIDTSKDLKDYSRMLFLFNAMKLYTDNNNSFKAVLEHSDNLKQDYKFIRKLNIDKLSFKLLDYVNELNVKAKKYYDENIEKLIIVNNDNEIKLFNKILDDLMYKIMKYYIENRKEDNTISNINKSLDIDENKPYDYFNETMNI